jgi:hypothetical protein
VELSGVIVVLEIGGIVGVHVRGGRERCVRSPLVGSKVIRDDRRKTKVWSLLAEDKGESRARFSTSM